MPRLFLAVWPPDDVVADLTALRRKDQRGVRFVAPERWHVTLRFLGEADPAAVLDALDGVELPATHARIGPAVDVLDQRVVVVPVAGLDELAAIVTRRTRDLGDPPPRRRFVGHLTIARLHRRAEPPPALGQLVDGSFDVDEVTLVQSRLEPSGARYETIAAWPVG